MAEAELFPERVVAGQGAPEAADAGGDAEGATVKSFEDFNENVNVVVDEELGSLFFLLLLLLHGSYLLPAVHHYVLLLSFECD